MVLRAMREALAEARIRFGRSKFEITVDLDTRRSHYLVGTFLTPIGTTRYNSGEVRRLNEELRDLGEPRIFLARGLEGREEVNYWERGESKYKTLSEVLG